MCGHWSVAAGLTLEPDGKSALAEDYLRILRSLRIMQLDAASVPEG